MIHHDFTHTILGILGFDQQEMFGYSKNADTQMIYPTFVMDILAHDLSHSKTKLWP